MLLSHPTCRLTLLLPDVLEPALGHKLTSCTLGQKLVLRACLVLISAKYAACVGIALAALSLGASAAARARSRAAWTYWAEEARASTLSILARSRIVVATGCLSSS